jgi:hypothetical protein
MTQTYPTIPLLAQLNLVSLSLKVLVIKFGIFWPGWWTISISQMPEKMKTLHIYHLGILNSFLTQTRIARGRYES